MYEQRRQREEEYWSWGYRGRIKWRRLKNGRPATNSTDVTPLMLQRALENECRNTRIPVYYMPTATEDKPAITYPTVCYIQDSRHLTQEYRDFWRYPRFKGCEGVELVAPPSSPRYDTVLSPIKSCSDTELTTRQDQPTANHEVKATMPCTLL